jgi:hypothetical protein
MQQIKWVNPSAPPAIGAKVKSKINGLGEAEVVAYVAVEGYMGIQCKFLNPPEWFVKQSKGELIGVLFGPEVAY